MRKISRFLLWRYLALFIGSIIFLFFTFNTLPFIYKKIILIPVSYTGFLILKILSIPIEFVGPVGIPGFCEYHLSNTVLQVTFGCTGIFSLFILLSGIIAFPGSLKSKGIGFIVAIPAFYLYSIFRLVIISIFGYLCPDSIKFVHSYIMEICNIAFILFVYVFWIRYVEKVAKTV